MEIFIAKAKRSITVDYDALPDVSKDYVINYGLRQALNDAAASVASDDTEVVEKTLALVDKRLSRILNGTVNVRDSFGREANPVMVEAIELALGTVRGEYKKNGKKLEAKAMLVDAKKKVAANPAYIHLAEKNVAQREADIAMLAAMGDVGELIDAEGLDEAA